MVHLQADFPGLVSYPRFVDFIPSALLTLCAYFQKECRGRCTGISFIDSTTIDVCLNQRIASHKVFAGLAQRGKTSTDWFFGFKLRLTINDRGELLSIFLTPGNVDDRKTVPKLVQQLFGKIYGDKGYISKDLQAYLLETFGLQLVTMLKGNTKNRLPMVFSDRLLLRKRAIDRAFTSSERRQLHGQYDLRVDCLCQTTKETIAGS